MAEEKKKKVKKATTAKKARAKAAPKKSAAGGKKPAKVSASGGEKTVAPKVEAKVEAKPEVKAVKPEPKPVEPKTEAVHAAPKVKVDKKIVRPKTVAYHGTGRRKTAIARVWLKPGKGEFNINGYDLDDYTKKRHLLLATARQPLIVTNTLAAYDVFAKIVGGGIPSQIGALAHGIARALLELNPDYRKILKREGLLTRDPRVKERKKYGRKKARKSFQYSKR